MAQPYVGEIRMFGGNFPPNGWLFCDGSQLAISENETLFQLIGTTYGGDGESTFNIPDLRSRLPMHNGNGPDGVNYVMAQAAGVESVTLTTQQIPIHTHPALASTANGSLPDPSGNVIAVSANTPNVFPYFEGPPNTNFANTAVSAVGGSQPHNNLQPYLAINFIISLFGIFPSPT
jgi:microcystin-dependent protein